MRLEISQFGGMAPVIDPTALGEKFGTLARNVRLDRGVLAPGALRLVDSGDYPDWQLSGRGVRSVSKLLESGTRFAFSHVDGANAFPSPVSPADTWGRVYFMTGSGPSFCTTDQYSPGGLVINPLSYRLGVPAPDSAALVASVEVEEERVGGAPVIDLEAFRENVAAAQEAGTVYEFGYDDIPRKPNPDSVVVESDPVSVAYAYSFVDRYGHESALSRSSSPVELAYDRPFSVTLQLSATLPTRVNFDGGYRRVYRATFDGSSSAWQYIGEVSSGSTTFEDTLPIGQESEEAVSENWLAAPDDLEQLCLVASAYAAGFFDHYVCYSELKLPHAWPAELQYPIKYSPVKLMPMLNGLLVATTGRPYWAEGADPYSAIPRELPINAPCVSADSVVDMGDYAMYASFEGLVAVGPNQAEVVTGSIVDRAVMEGLVDGTCTAFEFDGRYVFSTKDNRWMGFVPQEGFVEYDFGHRPDAFGAVAFSVRDNQHYFAFTNGTVRVVDFDGVSSDVEWHSKHWRTPPTSLSCFRVEADTYPVAVKVRSQYLSQSWQETPDMVVDGPHLQRLPVMTGGLWQVVVKPPQDGRVYRLILGQSGQEVS